MSVETHDPIGNEQIDEFLSDVLGLKSEGTYEIRRSDLANFHAYLEERDLDVMELSPRDIRQYLTWLNKQGYSGNTIESRYMSIQALYGDMVSFQEVIDEDENPMERFDRSSVSRLMSGTKKTDDDPDNLVYVTPEEVELMVKNVPHPETRNQLIIQLLFETGVRNHELHHMKVEHVDRDERSIQVQNRKTKDHGDDDSWRTVWWQPGPTDTLMATWIDHLRDTNHSARKSDRLFVTERSGKLGKRQIAELVSQTAEKVGIQEVLYTDPSGAERKRVTPHTLRHGHAVHAVRQDIDIAFIQEHMGHNDISTTKTYLQFKPSDVQAEYSKF